MKYSFLFLIIFTLTFSGCSKPENNMQTRNMPVPFESEFPSQAPDPAESVKPSEPPTPAPTQSPIPENEAKPEEKICEKQIAEAQTVLYDKSENRISNINLASDTINGYILSAGATFSFNDIVGKRTEDSGYKKAPVLFHGEKIYDFGGGVCQLSTTLFQAARSAGFEIIEKHNHKKPIDYAIPGDDAAVDYGNLDLKFQNNSDFDVTIYAAVTDDYVIVQICKP